VTTLRASRWWTADQVWRSVPIPAASSVEGSARNPDHTALVTSANLTGHGIDANMELGLLVRGGPVPSRLAAHLSELMASGTLVRIG